MGILDKMFGKKEPIAAGHKKPSNQITNTIAGKATPNAVSSVFPIPEAVWPDFTPTRLKREIIVSAAGAARKIPSLQGDYAKTVFLMMYARGTVSTSKPLPQYLLYECGIHNPATYRDSLVTAGLLIESDTEAVLSGLKLTDIKAICVSLGITQTGNKTVLIAKILSKIEVSKLAELLPNEKAYMHSDKGKAYLQKHEGYQILHQNQHWSISWKEYEQQHHVDESPYMTMLRIVQACLDKEPFNLVRNDYLALSEIYEQSGNKVKAAEMLLYVQYLDMSGMCSYDSIQFYYKNKTTYRKKIAGSNSMYDLMVSNYTCCTFAPAISERIAKYQDVISVEMINKICSWNLPVNACSPAEYHRIIFSILCGDLNVSAEQATLKANFIKAVG